MPLQRRQWLASAGGGIGSLALASLLEADGILDQPQPHFVPKATSVIWLFMEGGPSAMDTFDPKPELARGHGKQPKESIDVFFGNPGPLMKSPFTFDQYGDSGTWVCEHLPHLAQHVDDLALIKSVHCESPNHTPALFQMNTGLPRPGFPCAGSWLNYGLGTVNQNLPGFVVMQNKKGTKGGPMNWSSGFLPAAFQGTPFRTTGSPLLDLQRPDDMTESRQSRLLHLSKSLSQEHLEQHPAEDDLTARIRSYELAFAMQSEATEAVDLAQESAETRQDYGLDKETTRGFGKKCLLARRLVERGVRFVQAYCDGEWDAHGGLDKNHRENCTATDQPIAALLADLKSRGMLDSTLVIWGGEFGRMPISQRGSGRDHNPNGFLMWMAGGGIRGGTQYGETDEIGYKAVVNPVSVHDVHATILHLMGLDHKALTYTHNGRRYRLTDVAGNVIHDIIA
ncbi:MAG: DUF1501 domain-containing protein [Planctomycetota bacterium]